MFEKPTVADLREAAHKLGMKPSEAYLGAVEEIVTPIANAYAVLDATPDELPAVKYPRGRWYRPPAAENPYGAWYVKTAIKGKAGGKLAGRRVALKDNICLAGVPMMVGAQLLDGYVPEVDATVVERILDAGGEIAGKAVCEYFCVSGGSHTTRRVRCTTRASAAIPPADRPRAARRWSPPARWTWRSVATRPARSASRRATAASSG